ncbi:hypothetical protein ACFV1N_37290 [Streptosporangium canum]|uniref:hypothetical protein n=1 Tax=Streptosporangium canum TaxID=324952 RepID=UPI0036834972
MIPAISLPAGPVLTRPMLAALPLTAGRYLIAPYLAPTRFIDYEAFTELGILTAIYLITDSDSRIRWLGQASRDNGLTARLAEHHRAPGRRAVFATIRALHLHDHTPPGILNAIEGRCADQLQLRSVMAPRRWPTSRT